jgi:hypothetical protein
MFEDFIGITFLALCAAIAFCPPKYDPAIRLKEMNESWARRLRDRRWIKPT